MRYPIHFGGIGGVSFMHYSIGKFVDVLMLCQIDHLWMNVLYEGDQMSIHAYKLERQQWNAYFDRQLITEVSSLINII